MRKWCSLLVLVVVLLAPGVLGCSNSPGTSDSLEESTTSTQLTTTTTLGPASWQAIDPADESPEARFGGSITCLSSGDQLLLFGGWEGEADYLNDLWSYDTTEGTWTELEPSGTVPPARAAQAMAYDPISDRLFMFGGYDGTSYYADTWTYDPVRKAWSSVTSTGSTPQARYGHSLVYDPGSEKIILFGGFDGMRQYNDTWAYDPVTSAWTDLRPAGIAPQARDSQAMAYDSQNKVIVLFGGWNDTSTFDDTWTYDPAGNAWTSCELDGPPPAGRALHQMVYDPDIGKLVLFGGGNSSSTFNDTWLLDLDEGIWAPAVVNGELPSPRAGHSMLYDQLAHQVLFFGGTNGIGGYLNDMWRLSR